MIVATRDGVSLNRLYSQPGTFKLVCLSPEFTRKVWRSGSQIKLMKLLEETLWPIKHLRNKSQPPELQPSRQISSLRTLEDGWLDESGIAPSSRGLDWLLRMFETEYASDLPFPYLYPTEDGGVQAEWSIGTNDLTLEIALLDRVGHFHGLDLSDNSEIEEELSLREGKGWSQLEKLIRETIHETEYSTAQTNPSFLGKSWQSHKSSLQARTERQWTSFSLQRQSYRSERIVDTLYGEMASAFKGGTFSNAPRVR